MLLAALAPAWWIAFAGILLFLVLVVLRFTLTLVHQVKDLAESVREASERLQDALAEVRAESEQASERLESLGERSRLRRSR